MKYTLLLSRKCRIIGIVLLPFALALLFAVYVNNYSVPNLKWNDPPKENTGTGQSANYLFSKNFSADLSGELALLLTFTCLFFIAFSKLKHEDEYVGLIRLKALQISVYANYIILALASIVIYGISFLLVMEINLFTILIIFIMVFYAELHIRPLFKSGRV